MTIQAINPTHQRAVNKAVKCLIKYNELNDMRNAADNECDDKLTAKLDNKAAIAWDRFYDAMYYLPKREKALIEKSNLY